MILVPLTVVPETDMKPSSPIQPLTVGAGSGTFENEGAVRAISALNGTPGVRIRLSNIGAMQPVFAEICRIERPELFWATTTIVYDVSCVKPPKVYGNATEFTSTAGPMLLVTMPVR
jgi:hypothetical protein